MARARARRASRVTRDAIRQQTGPVGEIDLGPEQPVQQQPTQQPAPQQQPEQKSSTEQVTTTKQTTTEKSARKSGS